MQDFKKLPEYQAMRKALTCLALELPEPVHVDVCRIFNEFANALSVATPAPLADAELGIWDTNRFQEARHWVNDVLSGPINSLVLEVIDQAFGLLARPAAAEASKWIAVGDQLPVDEIDNHDNPFGTTLVLVARPAAPYVSAVALGYRYDGDWFIVREGTEDDFVDNSVTHWQPAVAPTVKGGQQDA